MAKNVISDISWTYAVFSGNVDTIKIKRHFVLDNDDLQKLESKISYLQDKVEQLERQNNLIKEIFKDSVLKVEKENSELVNSIIGISQDARDKILQIILNSEKMDEFHK